MSFEPLRHQFSVLVFIAAGGTLASMQTYRDQLVRALSEIDGLLIEAESIVEDSEGTERDSALDILIEFQDVKRFVEGELAREIPQAKNSGRVKVNARCQPTKPRDSFSSHGPRDCESR